ncbi:MAG: transcriptional regulator, partial [Clostridia bacterium]|nr:transcriptional regulator [Clostridia bacterium]
RVPPGLAECIKGIKVPDAAPSVQPSPEEIRALREERGLRLKDVAAAFGKSVSAIQTYENGRAPVPPGLAECIEGIKEPIPDDIILPTPAEEIKALREERGLSRRAVAEAFGKSEGCIYAYETGRSHVPPGLAECIKGMAEPLPPPDNEAGPPVSPEELLALRTARNLSALKLSKALGISNSSLRNYETGRTPVPKGLAEKIVALFPDVPDLGESPDPIRDEFCADDLRKLRL